MPRYDYQCVKCNETKEKTHSIPECDWYFPFCDSCGNKMKRLIPGQHIKGKGIYPFVLGDHAVDETVPGFRDIVKRAEKGYIIESKEHHKQVLENQKATNPYIHGSKHYDNPNFGGRK